MAVSAGVVAAKVAATIATDKKLRKIAIWVILIVLVLVISPIMMLMAVFDVGSRLDFNTLGITDSMNTNLSPALRAEVNYMNSVMESLKSAATANAPGADFLFIQVVYLCAFAGAEKWNSTFYDDFTLCFAEGDVFENLYETFDWAYSSQDVADIMSLYSRVSSSAQLPGSGIHGSVGDLTREYGGSLPAGGFSPPFHDQNYRRLITDGYGRRTDPVTGEPGVAHTGVDFGLSMGTSVYPIMEGKVILTGSGNTGYGNYVVVAHGGGYASLYGHLSQVLVSPGRPVSKDTVIGYSGNSGKSTGPHLHLEIIIDGQPVDPMRYMP